MLKEKKFFLKVILMMVIIALSVSTQVFAATLNNVTGLKYNMMGDRAYLTWNSVSNATGYEVYVNINERGYQYLGDARTNSVTVIGFIQDNTYALKVRAYRTSNGSRTYSSNYSNEIEINRSSVTIEPSNNLDTVKNLKYTINGEQVKLTWNSVSKASGYEVYVNLDGKGYQYLGNVAGTSATVQGFAKEKNYYFKVRAYRYVNGTKEYSEDYSNEVNVYIKNQKPATVTGVKAEVDGTVVTVKWNKVDNVSGYRIALTRPGETTEYYTTTSTEKVFSGITDTKSNYKVKVCAYNYSNGVETEGNYSATVSFKAKQDTNVTKPDKVTGLTADVYNNTVTVEWNRVDGVAGYRVALTRPGKATEYYTTTSTKKSFSGITDTKSNYTVKVCAYKYINGSRVEGEYSKSVTFKAEQTETKLAKVTGLTGKVSGTTVNLTWNKVANATGYEISMVIPGYGTTTMYTTTNSREVSGLTTYGYSYTTKVRAYGYDKNGRKIYGDYSNSIYVYREGKEEEKATTKPAKVTGLTAKVTGTKATITWNKVTNADGYEISMVIPGYGTTTISAKSNSKEIEGLTTYGSSYTTKVRAYTYDTNGKKVYGDYSNSISIYRK